MNENTNDVQKEIESVLENDEAYGSNVTILSYSSTPTKITGKFKDSWNNRVFDFTIDEDGVGYKPSVNLDSVPVESQESRFDSFSDGYLSGIRTDGKLTGKRTKKPKCGGTSFGCGYSCVGLTKVCRITSGGKKIEGHQGSNVSKERISKLLAMASKPGADPKFQIHHTEADRVRTLAKMSSKQRHRMRIRPEEKAETKQNIKEPEEPQNETREFPNKNTQAYYKILDEAIKTGKLSSDTKKNINDYMAWMHSFSGEIKNYGTTENSKRAIRLKQQRILDEMGEDLPESALGLAAYLHGHPFGKMNGVLWRKDIDNLDKQISEQEGRSSDEFTKQYIALDVGAANALDKLPPLSQKTLEERYKGYEIDTDNFHRYMTLPEGDVLKGFLADHKPGETIEYHSFQSYTVFKKEDATPNIANFSKSANVKYTLSRKKDTQAKAVDHFKSKAVEGEVLYAPGTKFKITKVEEEQTETVGRFPFQSIGKYKREQKKLSAFVDKIPEKEWNHILENLTGEDRKLQNHLKDIRNKAPNPFGTHFSLYVNKNPRATNMLFDLMEKAGVKLEKDKTVRHHIHMEEV